MPLNNYSNSTMTIGDTIMAEDAFSKSKFEKPPKSVLDSTRPEKVKRLFEKQLGIMDVFNSHIKDERNWVTATQLYVLYTLFSKLAVSGGRGVEMTEIPHELKLKSATVNRIVQTFSGNDNFKKQLNWFYSVPAPHDNRKTILMLDTDGTKVMNDLILAMQAEVYGGFNPNVELYKKAEEAAKAKVAMKVDAGEFVTEGLAAKADVFSQIKGTKGTGEVGNVEIKTENVTTGAPEVEPATILELGPVTIDINKQLMKRREAKRQYDIWRSTAEGQEYLKNRDGKPLLGEPFLSRNFGEITPPVSRQDLMWSKEECTAFAVQMVRALDEQLSTEAKEKLIQYVIESLPLLEWNIVKDYLRQHNDNKLRTRKWLAEEQERIMAQASTIASPSERQDFIAQEYASRRNAEIEAAAQVNAEQQEQLREQIADELRMTLRNEVREEVRKELLQQLLKGE